MSDRFSHNEAHLCLTWLEISDRFYCNEVVWKEENDEGFTPLQRIFVNREYSKTRVKVCIAFV